MRPEIEAFDTGHLWFAKQLVTEGLLKPDALVQLCMGVPWGAPDDLNTFMAMVNNVPADWTFSAFSLGRNQMAYVAAAVLAGGNVRVGLEDNLWLDKGVLATNAQLVERAVTIVESMGARVIGPDEVRKKLKLDQARAAGGVRLEELRNDMTIDKAAAIGGGVIGAGWVARLVLNGIDVVDLRSRPGGVAQGRRGDEGRAPRLQADAAGRPAEGRQADLRQDHRRSGDGRRLHPGKRAGTARAEAQGAGRDRRARAGQCAGRLVDLRHQADRHADGDEEASRAAGRRPSVQPGLSAAAGRDRRRRADVAGGDRGAPGRSMPRSA